MCGIVGYVGSRQATPLLVAGLRKLEYRGYDSAGVSVWDGGKSRVVRCQGKLRGLEERLAVEPAPGCIGIGHTRWATHGRPSDANAHPHKVGAVSVVHNGIIENHLALRQELMAAGASFSSETDTEIVAHLVDRALAAGAPDLTTAVRQALGRVHGAYAIVVMSPAAPRGTRAHRRVPDRGAGAHPGRGRATPASSATATRSSTPATLVVAISQSGETADTLAAMREAKERGAGARALQRRRLDIPRLADGTRSTPTPAPRSASPRPRPSPPSWCRALPARDQPRARARARWQEARRASSSRAAEHLPAS
jgi:glucosamine 6-phosphate synthetase-like amidotransferase/phosphosugar isomerase protein